MSEKPRKECCSCVNWQRDGSDGICRAHSPRPETLASGERFTVYWPRSKAEDWCAEWEGEES